jgi:hypothetical protein
MAHFKRFTMPTLAPEGGIFVLNIEKGILSLLSGEELIEQQLLTDSEMYLISELFAAYPDYCPYEVLLSAMSNESLEKCRQQVLWGLEEGTIDAVMRPVRNLLSRCRMKLHPFGIEITSLHETGYLLTPLKRKEARRATAERGRSADTNTSL